MEFDVKIWRNYYDHVNVLGQYLKDSYPDYDGNPPKVNLTLKEKTEVLKEIEELQDKCTKYLDKCRLYPREPKWYYDRNNETTWPSSEKFIFHHLMPRKKYVTINL